MAANRVFDMPFAKVYQALVAKAERKGRTRAEVDEVTCWLTGYTPAAIADSLASDVTYGDFFRQAPAMNPDRAFITGTVCGVKVQEVADPLMRDIRYLDKLVDELARGKAMDKVLRSPAPSASVTAESATTPSGARPSVSSTP